MDIKTIIISSIVFLLVDFIWIGISKNLWSEAVLKLTGKPMKANMLYAAMAYLVLIIGYLYFIQRNVDSKNISKSILDAFLLGIVIYGTFDFTNLAIFKDYPLKLGLMDTLWGGILHVVVLLIVNKVLL